MTNNNISKSLLFIAMAAIMVYFSSCSYIRKKGDENFSKLQNTMFNELMEQDKDGYWRFSTREKLEKPNAIALYIPWGYALNELDNFEDDFSNYMIFTDYFLPGTKVERDSSLNYPEAIRFICIIEEHDSRWAEGGIASHGVIFARERDISIYDRKNGTTVAKDKLSSASSLYISKAEAEKQGINIRAYLYKTNDQDRVDIQNKIKDILAEYK